ncbi:MAG: hypothetical protein N3E48_03270 [Candidatus Bathyarchaeota archaeon]|nr:hypothetical protein [Candidatus Bathyarchaeota archaeon]
MVKGRVLRLLLLITFFWVVFLATSWLLAKFYLPLVKLLFQGKSLITPDVATWIGVLIVLLTIIVLFKELLYIFFYVESLKNLSTPTTFNKFW